MAPWCTNRVFLPRFIGVWLIINGVAYLVLSLTGLFFPDYQNKVFAYSQPARSGSWRSCCGRDQGANPPGLEQRGSTA